jgi:uncharacterized membrane protein YbhN (UPF0104 family)
MSSVLLEKLIDVVILAAAGIFVFYLAYSGVDFDNPADRLIKVLLVGVLALLLMPPLIKLAQRSQVYKNVSEMLPRRLQIWAEYFVEGLTTLREKRAVIKVAGISALIWAVDASAILLVSYGLGVEINLNVALAYLTLIGFAGVLNLTPASIGVNQVIAVTFLPGLGLGIEQALALSLGFQGVVYSSAAVAGLVALIGIISRPILNEKGG